jgi:LacI family transcriptional regulator
MRAVSEIGIRYRSHIYIYEHISAMAKNTINIDTIAAASGYSRATVSRVIRKYGYVSKEAREKICSVIEEYDYRPSSLARSMVSGKTHTIGLLLTDIRNHFYSVMAKSIENQASSMGYALIICNSDESLDKEKEYFELLMEKQVDGLIISPTIDMHMGFSDIFEKIKKRKIPCVCVDRALPPEFGIPSVLVDNYQGGYDAGKHLVNMGHNRLAVVTSKIPLPNVRDREKGFFQALKDAGIERQTGDRIELESREREIDIESQLHLFEGINKFSAVFCTANTLSFYALRILKYKGIEIPARISFISFDDLYDAELISPQPTVIVQPVSDIGTKAAMIILNKLIKKKSLPKKNTVFPVSMIIRESTK